MQEHWTYLFTFRGTDGPVDMYIDAFDGGKFLPPREVSMIIGQPVSAEMHRVTPCEVGTSYCFIAASKKVS